MQELNNFSTLSEQESSKITGGSWWSTALQFAGEQAFEHIDDISRGFRAGNHRHTR